MNEAPFISLPIYTAATTTTSPSPPPSTTPTSPSPPTTTITHIPKLTCFRILCHSSRIGGIIGKSGSIIKKLQKATCSKIRVLDSHTSSEFCVISISADSTMNKTMSFRRGSENENDNGNDMNVSVSDAQEGLVRVYERILNVAAADDNNNNENYDNCVVSCRLLVDASYVGFLIGKNGKGVEKIRKDSCCKIKIFSQGRLPSCALPNDEMIEIEGDIVAVKKALIAISGRLQECPPSDKTTMVLDRPWNSSSYPLGTKPFRSLNTEAFPSVNFIDSQGLHEIVFRILCSSDRVGGVIGNSGTIVRALETESGARIQISPPAEFHYEERLITITALESLESRISPAQNAVILVFNRSVEAGYEKGLDSPSLGTQITARLVIPSNHMGCLLGKRGSIIADMRKVTGAYIKIVGGDEAPRCVPETDQVVLITGELTNVRDALYSVTTRLRNFLLSSKKSSGPNTSGAYAYGNGQPPFGMHPSITTDHFNQHTSLTLSMDNLTLRNVDHPSSSMPQKSRAGDGNRMNGQDIDRGMTPHKGGIELGSGNRSAIVINTTVEIMIPKNDIGLIYGENGSNLTHLRQISGAKIVIHEVGSGLDNPIVVISGTPEETQSAQSLLQAFILADQH